MAEAIDSFMWGVDNEMRMMLRDIAFDVVTKGSPLNEETLKRVRDEFAKRFEEYLQ